MLLVTCILICAMVCATAYAIQQSHYKYLASRRRHSNHLALITHLEAKLQDLEQLKSKVDSLMIRSGFKL